MIPYTITNDSITVIRDGKPLLIKKGAANYPGLMDALLSEDWERAEEHMTPESSLAAWAQGAFTVDGDGHLHYGGRPVPAGISKHAGRMAADGKDPTELFRFWERLKRNPSMRSVEQLHNFIQHENIPLTPDGCFLAYKYVRADFKDVHSGNHDNSIGKVLEMPRNEISDDPNHACHAGFHVGALPYVQSGAGRDNKIVICKIDPEHVVCVPYDSSQHKMRVCKYEVVGLHSGQPMPSTTFDYEAEGTDAEDYDYVTAGGKFAKYDEMSALELLDLSLGELRSYAARGLKVVGATKVPGGKFSLLELILSARGG